MRPLRPCALVLFAAILVVLPAAALAVSPKPVTPANGSTVTITPTPGFANGDARLTWSIDYPDCPGPASIHSSFVELREPGGAWRGESRGGPFLGNGTFTALTSLFPGPTARRIEWRVFWACGATTNFAGSQGRSGVVFFTLQPAGGVAPASPCASLTGNAKTRCLAKVKRDAQLKKCAAIKAKTPRDACVKKARAAYANAITHARVTSVS